MNLKWLRLNDDSPIFESFLTKEVFTEVLNSLEFLAGILSAALQYSSHLEGIFSDCLGDSVDCTELRWKMTVLSIDSDLEQRLLAIINFQLVGLGEVLGNADSVALVV